jgi:hypothetical protein
MRFELVRVPAYSKFELTAAEIDFLLYGEVLPCFEVTTCKFFLASSTVLA